MSPKANFSIEKSGIGKGYKPFLIAEIAQNHDGSLGTAHAYIDAVADTGCDAIKFQAHLAEYESTLDEPFRIAFSKQDPTRYDYWKRMEFTPEQWEGLALHAKKRGIIFLCSAFSVKAVDMLSKIGMPAWKVGSGDAKNVELLEAMAANGAPVLFSTGMSSNEEIKNTVSLLDEKGLAYGIFQCTSKYPCSLEEVGLNVIGELRDRFQCPIGLSDHSGTPFPGLAAMARGVNLLEVHVVFDRRTFGPDVPVSITLEELSLLTQARDAFWMMDSNPVEKDIFVEGLSDMRQMFDRSLALARTLEKGTVLLDEMLLSKKPGMGIPVAERNKIVGRKLRCKVTPDRLLRWEDLDD